MTLHSITPYSPIIYTYYSSRYILVEIMNKLSTTKFFLLLPIHLIIQCLVNNLSTLLISGLPRSPSKVHCVDECWLLSAISTSFLVGVGVGTVGTFLSDRADEDKDELSRVNCTCSGELPFELKSQQVTD